MPFVIFLNFSEWAFRPKARTSRVEIKEIWAVPMDGATTDQHTQRLRILQRRYTRQQGQGQTLFAVPRLPAWAGGNTAYLPFNVFLKFALPANS